MTNFTGVKPDVYKILQTHVKSCKGRGYSVHALEFDRQCNWPITMPVYQRVYDGPNNVKLAVCGSKPASWLFLFSKKFAAGLPTGKPAANFSKNQNNQKSSALASLNPCTVEVAETNARKEGIGSFVGSDMCCQLFLFMNQSLQHTPCMCVLNPIVSTFHHWSKQKNCDSFRQVRHRRWRRRRSPGPQFRWKRPWW